MPNLSKSLLLLIFSSLLGVFLPAPPASASVSELKLSSNRTVALESELEPSAKQWIVFLPGSGCGLYNLQQSLWLNTLRAQEVYNVLVINKAGVTADNQCFSLEYEEGSLRHNRIADIGEAIRQMIPAEDSILLVGFSEGAYIAPDVAAANSNIEGLVLLSGGTQSLIEEEIMLAAPSERESLKKFFETEVMGSQDLSRFYNGFSYAVLNSFHNRHGYESLLSLEIPILAMHGEKDNLIWLEGNIRDFQSLIEVHGKKNIEHHVLPNGNHGLFCDDGGDPSRCLEKPAQETACGLLLDFTQKIH